MLDLVPLRGSRRRRGTRQVISSPGPRRQRGQLGFPGAGAILAVGAARIRGRNSSRRAEGSRCSRLPSTSGGSTRRRTQRCNRRCRRTPQPGVGGHAHRRRMARPCPRCPGKSSVRVTAGLALGPPLAARVEPPTSSFFWCHADHRIGGALVSLDLLADVPELRVPVRLPQPSMVLALPCSLNPSARPWPPTVSRADPVTQAGQLGRQLQYNWSSTAAATWIHPAPCRVPPSPAAPGADPDPDGRPVQQPPAGAPSPARSPESSSSTPSDTVAARGPRRPGPPPGSRHVQRPGLGPQPQPALPLIQMAGRSPETSPPAPAGFPP